MSQALAVFRQSPVSSFALGAGSVWVPDPADDAVLRIDQTTGAIVSDVRVGRQPIGAVFANGAVWVANSRDGTVSRIDPDTLDVTSTTVGGTPTGHEEPIVSVTDRFADQRLVQVARVTSAFPARAPDLSGAASQIRRSFSWSASSLRSETRTAPARASRWMSP